MAGNYPDVPSYRMAYDRDGTQVYRRQGSTLTAVDNTRVVELNREPQEFGTRWYGPNDRLVFIFPELRDIDGFLNSWFRGQARAESSRAYVSADTTNGIDGTWVQLGPLFPLDAAMKTTGPSKEEMRTKIIQATALGVRAFAMEQMSDDYVNVVHIYGEPSPNENPDRLEIWHPSLDQKADPEYLDWGDAARESSASKVFRVKNVSPTKTAQSIRIAMEVLSDSPTPLLPQMALSLDGASWLAQVNIGNLGPGQISQEITLRRTLLTNADLSLWWFRVFAESTTSWI